MAVFENSRYLNTTMYNRLNSDTYVFRIRERNTFSEEGVQFYEWKGGDTLDVVAYNYYDDCRLRWAILDANPKYRTEYDIMCGDILAIPDYEEVVSLVNGEDDSE